MHPVSLEVGTCLRIRLIGPRLLICLYQLEIEIHLFPVTHGVNCRGVNCRPPKNYGMVHNHKITVKNYGVQ